MMTPVIPESHRPYNAEAVVSLKKSIERIGLQEAPTFVEGDGCYTLISGRHRLEALRLLGAEQIPARIVDFDSVDARLWTISENLHRCELSALERAEQVAEYAQLAAQRGKPVEPPGKPAQVAHLSGEQPVHDKPAQVAQVYGRGNFGGDSQVARDLGISRDDVRRSKAIDSLSPAAKAIAVEAGVGDNRSALLAAAKESTPEGQTATIRRIAERKASSATPAEPPAVKSLRNLENISGGEFAKWIKGSTPHSRQHVIRTLRMAADILENELKAGEAANA
jgi:ParB-like nuclease domain